jgi:hypothetical protein
MKAIAAASQAEGDDVDLADDQRASDLVGTWDLAANPN